MIADRFSVEARAARFQRRYTGPVVVQQRYRRRSRIEFVRLSVATHDLWTHALWRGVIVPVVRPIVARMAAKLA